MADAAKEDAVEPPRFAYRVNDFARAIGLTPATLYKLRREDKLTMVKVGGRTLIPASEGDRLIAEACAHVS